MKRTGVAASYVYTYAFVHKITFVINNNKQEVCHIVTLPFTLQTILRSQKNKNCGTQIFHHEKI
jgi:hypothetical protein